MGVIVFMASLSAFGDELVIAREALRDGLWDVARTHAAKSEDPAARLVVVESFAREGKWKELVEAIEGWGNPEDEPFLYYRALALVETGKAAQANYILADRKFADPAYSRLATRLKARIAMSEKGAAEALKVVKDAPGELVDEDSEMLAASLMAANGDKAGAEDIWRAVVERGTNASERAFVDASVNLNDEQFLRAAFGRSVSAESKRKAGFALGRKLLSCTNTVDEGTSIIRGLVRDAPDANGSRDALADIADAYRACGRFADAAAVYKETFETWPDAKNLSRLQDGLGWALEELGKYDEALEAFARAEETAATDEERARAIVKQGDVLAAAGKTDESLAKYRAVLSKYPATDSAARIKDLVRIRDLEDRGRELYREYRFAEAQKAFREVAEKDPTLKPRMNYLEAMCMYGQGLDDEAEKLLRRIASESGDADTTARAVLWLAKHSYNRGAWQESRKLFAEYAEKAPESPDAPEALVWAARAAFAENDFQFAIQTVTRLAEKYPGSPSSLRGLLVQGEALIELARFDEAVLVLERVAIADGIDAADKLSARLLGADALFAMGADNPVRYQEALDAYRGVRMGESLSASQRISVSYKVAKTLEKLKRVDESIDRYYTDVVLAYREARLRGERMDDEASAAFSRAVFELADEFESRGRDFQAVQVLELLAKSDVPAAVEAKKRIERIKRKGKYL
ncbi:MAG: tetratricopeptide repeat protein [Kiritimatiellae bacterium]|nr:tetratricopeptide repeat protein [Kiritimatiellia bacterium]